MESMNNKPAGSGATGLQKVDRQAALASLRQPAGDIVDFHELAPVMESFRQHMATEQEKNRRRIRTMGFVFALILCVLVVVPLYLARTFIAANNRHWEAQKANQDRIAKSLADGMVALTEQSESLRQALDREHALLAAAATSAPPQTIIVTAASPTIVISPPVSQQPSTSMPVIEMPPPVIPGASVGLGETLLRSPLVVMPSHIGSGQIIEAQLGDLKSMLDQVETAIAVKRRELEMRRASGQSGR
jgi:hypothetical protein